MPNPNMRLANRRSSSIGAGVRSSQRMNTAVSRMTSTAPMMTGGDCQPSPLPLPTTSSSASRMTPDTVAPSQSKAAAGPGPRRYWPAASPRSSSGQESSNTRHPAGTLTKNTDCQPSQATRNPPIAGPAMAPRPTTLRCIPSALPRSESGKAASIMPIPQPCTIPAPMPCRARIMMSSHRLPDRPAPSEAMTKIAVPIR